MNDRSLRYGPVSIGGVGGSGTRLIASFLKELGFFMGYDLNAASDNLWFALLFARPNWFVKSSEEEVYKALSIFDKAMIGRLRLSYSEFGFLIRAAYDLTFREYLHWEQVPWKLYIKKIAPLKWSLNIIWSLKRILNMARSRRNELSSHIGWGWKEPCTYIYIQLLNEYFENIKYIHVIRNGLDMAYSTNQGHLIAWGSLFSVQMQESKKLMPKVSLDYWIKANEKTIKSGKRLLNDRFLLINFDQLCMNPRNQVEKLIEFLEIDCQATDISKLCGLCKVPQSLGRYREHQPIFDQKAINAVQRLGFAVDNEWLANS